MSMETPTEFLTLDYLGRSLQFSQDSITRYMDLLETAVIEANEAVRTELNPYVNTVPITPTTDEGSKYYSKIVAVAAIYGRWVFYNRTGRREANDTMTRYNGSVKSLVSALKSDYPQKIQMSMATLDDPEFNELTTRIGIGAIAEDF